MSIVGARPRRSHHPDIDPPGAKYDTDRRGFRSISVLMAGADIKAGRRKSWGSSLSARAITGACSP
jgi:hypothetical protein